MAMSFPKPNRILTNPSLTSIELEMTKVALNLALLGQVSASRSLISILYSRPQTNVLDNVGLRPLTILWCQTDFPTGTPRFKRSEEYISDAKTAYPRDQWPDHVPAGSRTWDKTGLEAALALPEQPGYGVDVEIGLTRALESAIAITKDRAEELKSSDEIQRVLSATAQNFGRYNMATILAYSETCWPLLMTGALATALDIQDPDTIAEELLSAFKTRYLNGPARLQKSIPELLSLCSTNTAATSEQDYWKEMDQLAPTSLFQTPATTPDITALETKLNIILPSDFKLFLSISNGFGGIWNGYHIDPPLFPVSDVDWESWTGPEDTALLFEPLTLPHTVCRFYDAETRIWDEKVSFPRIVRWVSIASEDIGNVWLMPPEVMESAREEYKRLYEEVDEEGKATIERAVEAFAGSWEEWEGIGWSCVEWWAGGSADLSCYKSFEAWLEVKVWESGSRT